jgi:hypothetical protein
MSDPEQDGGTQVGHEAEQATRSERYELEDLFPGVSRETLRLLRLVGLALLIVLMVLALAYPFAWLSAC